MPVSGLVLTLSPGDGGQVAQALGADPRVTVGERAAQRLPVVTETDTMGDHLDLWNELEGLDGVLQVELAFHDFSDVGDFELPPRRRSRPGGG